MQPESRVSRREFLKTLGVILAGAGLSGLAAACQRAAEPAPPPPPGDAAKSAVEKIAPVVVNGVPVTANDDFYTVWYSNGTPPAVPRDWKLRLVGLVEQPLELTLEQIQAMPVVEELRTLECISNPVGGDLISNAIWKGVRLNDLLERAKIKTGAAFLKLESFDNFFTGIPIELGMNPHALLVYDMNGEPLPRDHGAPLRCLWPGRYGMKQPKWLHTITVVDKPFLGYWEKQGWTNDAFILPNSQIAAPKDLATVSDKAFTLSGVAFSGEAGIAKIEISSDDSDKWQAAELTRGPSPYVWTIWKWTGTALEAGRHTLYARVTDKAGNVQKKPQRVRLLDGTFPNGTDEMHSIILDFRA